MSAEFSIQATQLSFRPNFTHPYYDQVNGSYKRGQNELVFEKNHPSLNHQIVKAKSESDDQFCFSYAISMIVSIVGAIFTIFLSVRWR